MYLSNLFLKKMKIKVNFFFKGHIESNTGKSARQGNLQHPRVRFQSFADEARRVCKRLKSYPRVSEISLSCTFCQRLILFLTFISCFQFRVCLCTFSRRSCKQCELFPLHVNQKTSSVFCVLREGYYVIIWLIDRICVFIKD